MQSSLKKSLYLGLAALSFVSVAAVSTTASAKSAAKVTSDKVLTSDANTRNINLTGKNAIYTKPGTAKGAKVVATTTTTKNLKNDKTSQKNFRAYRMAKTNRGSYYYKVVSYDKQYRGWVYGGKTANSFNGGVSAYTTFKDGTLTDAQKTGTYKITNVGKANDGTQVTYKAPAWTQYKIGRAITDTTAYKNATFSIDKVGTRTREGDVWVHIVNTNTADTKANGWILNSALTDANPLADNAIRINLVGQDGTKIGSFDYAVTGATKGKTLGSLTDAGSTGVFSWKLPATLSDGTVPATDLAKKVDNALQGSGYTLTKGTDGNPVLTASQQSTLAQGKFGSDVTLSFTKGNTVYTQFTATSRDVNSVSAKSDTMTSFKNADAAAGTLKNTSGLLTVKPLYVDTSTDADNTTPTAVPAGLDDLTSLYDNGDTTDYKTALKAITSDPAALKAYNANLAISAAQFYQDPDGLKVSDLFSGAEGATFTKQQALAYLNGNTQLANLKSAVYPQVDNAGNITWHQLTYSPADADAGTFGAISKAVFSYDINKSATVSIPTQSTTNGNDTESPLA